MGRKTKTLSSKQAERRLLKLNWPLSLTLSPRAGRGEPNGYAAAITGITVNSAYEMAHSIEHAGFKMGGKGDEDKKKNKENKNKPK